MVAQLIRRLSNSLLLMAVLFLFLIGALYYVANTGQHLDSFGRSYQRLMLGTAIALALIGILVIASVWRLVVDLRRNVSGSRLSLKLVVVLVGMALLPMTLEFLNSNIESWFDVEVESALDNALELSRDSLDAYMRTRQKTTLDIAKVLGETPQELAIVVLNELGPDSGAVELTLIGADNRVVATTAFIDLVRMAPDRPADDIVTRARNGDPYLSIDPAYDGDLEVRSVVPVLALDPADGAGVLFATYPVPRSSTELAASVQESFRNYRELAYLREPLKQSSIATLTLAVFLSLMMAVWVAFYAARRLMVPVHDLVEGTRLVSAGDYTTRLSTSGRDELGYLVNSFNDMTDKIEAARTSAAESQQQAENQRAYLELVLSRISTGVLAIDENYRVRTSNASALKILNASSDSLETIDACALDEVDNTYLQQFFSAVQPMLTADRKDWSLELELSGDEGRIPVLCRGATMLSANDEYTGHVLVFDDISDVVEAQRNAAWSEVARRLAHEIKNPLTPIQLSAERLQHKYASKLQGDDASTLKKLTNTIVQQVEAMKSMVKAFADYANAPQADFKRTALNELITEVSWLYRSGDDRDAIALRLEPQLPDIAGDPTRLRQLLHNVVKNAFEAMEGNADRCLNIHTFTDNKDHATAVVLQFEDNGPGFPQEMLDRLFEPYVTSKKKGTGLGLAIVKKIVEEHGGAVSAGNIAESGGRILIRFPLERAGRRSPAEVARNEDTMNRSTPTAGVRGDAA